MVAGARNFPAPHRSTDERRVGRTARPGENMPATFAHFRDFYPHYLDEHRHPVSRRLHFAGTALVLLTLGAALVSGHWRWLWWMPVFGYGLAWIGHYFFEKNRPATFRHPLYSLLGDFVMFRDILLGRLSLR